MGTDFWGQLMLWVAYTFVAILTTKFTPDKPGIKNLVFFKIIVPVLWLLAFVYVYTTQPRPDYLENGRA